MQIFIVSSRSKHDKWKITRCHQVKHHAKYFLPSRVHMSSITIIPTANKLINYMTKRNWTWGGWATKKSKKISYYRSKRWGHKVEFWISQGTKRKCRTWGRWPFSVPMKYLWLIKLPQITLYSDKVFRSQSTFKDTINLGQVQWHATICTWCLGLELYKVSMATFAAGNTYGAKKFPFFFLFYL